LRVGDQFGKHKTTTVFVLLVLFSLVSLTLSGQSAGLAPKRVGLTVFSTFQSGFHRVGSFVSGTVNSVRELGQLQQDYQQLLSQLREYQGIKNDVVELRHEVDRLRRVLGFSESLDYQNVPAQIIGKDPGNLFSTITINKGSQDGMEQDMPVVAVQEGTQGLVGKIESVGLNSSVVVPLFHSANYVAARLQRSRYEGLVHGDGKGGIRMRYVSDQARTEIGYGDLVITSGMSSVYPKGIHIGTVVSVEAQPYDTSLELKLDPIVDFERLEYVFVIRE
jgi:rod shape-determining protein MreC